MAFVIVSSKERSRRLEECEGREGLQAIVLFATLLFLHVFAIAFTRLARRSRACLEPTASAQARSRHRSTGAVSTTPPPHPPARCGRYRRGRADRPGRRMATTARSFAPSPGTAAAG